MKISEALCKSQRTSGKMAGPGKISDEKLGWRANVNRVRRHQDTRRSSRRSRDSFALNKGVKSKTSARELQHSVTMTSGMT